MLELGKIQPLRITKKKDTGYIAKSRIDVSQVFISEKDVIGEVELGDEIDVFVYKSMGGDLVGTMKTPKIVPGQIKELEVVDTAKFGAFLDWGLDKDLLLPTKRQVGDVRVGDKCLVSVYIDKNEHICATMDLYRELLSDSEFKKDDMVNAVVYEINNELGVLLAVEDKYHGLLPKHEVFKDYQVGDRIECRVTKVREDGKLNLSARQKAYQQMDKDSEIIYESLKENGGFLSVNDKSDPQLIKLKFGLSKKAFKRAIGRLYKEKKIEFKDEGIQLVQK